MNKHYGWQSWLRFLLWSYAIGMVGFYLILRWRTAPRKEDRVTVLPRNSSVVATADPMVSIIVPVRNEERNIQRCVQSLLEQDYEHYEVITVDDGSTDGTGHILNELTHIHPHGNRLWVLRLRNLAAGWADKPYAIHMGVQEAQGEWLLFTDADTWHAPHALRSSIMQALQQQIDMFTLRPAQKLPSFGRYILIRREVYDLVGGYARPDLRGTLLDGRNLARVVKENGFKVLSGNGCSLH